MGFFKKIKNKLGIGGVKVTLNTPGNASIEEGVVKGSFVLTTKSDQEIVNSVIEVYESETTGRGDNKEEEEYTLGKTVLSEGFTIKEGETRTIEFSVPFSMHEKLKDKKGALGKVGKLASLATNTRSKYFVKVDVDVKSAALDPLDYKEIVLN